MTDPFLEEKPSDNKFEIFKEAGLYAFANFFNSEVSKSDVSSEIEDTKFVKFNTTIITIEGGQEITNNLYVVLPVSTATSIEYYMLSGVAPIKEEVDDEVLDSVETLLNSTMQNFAKKLNNIDDCTLDDFEIVDKSIVSIDDINLNDYIQIDMEIEGEQLHTLIKSTYFDEPKSDDVGELNLDEDLNDLEQSLNNLQNTLNDVDDEAELMFEDDESSEDELADLIGELNSDDDIDTDALDSAIDELENELKSVDDEMILDEQSGSANDSFDDVLEPSIPEDDMDEPTNDIGDDFDNILEPSMPEDDEQDDMGFEEIPKLDENFESEDEDNDIDDIPELPIDEDSGSIELPIDEDFDSDEEIITNIDNPEDDIQEENNMEDEAKWILLNSKNNNFYITEEPISLDEIELKVSGVGFLSLVCEEQHYMGNPNDLHQILIV
jgi:chemotaxis protein CheY-P-specific phosphatase CheC